MTLSDPQPGFQGHGILTTWISQKRCVLGTKLLKKTLIGNHTRSIHKRTALKWDALTHCNRMKNHRLKLTSVTCAGVRVETTVPIRVTRAQRATASGLSDTLLTRCTRTWITARRWNINIMSPSNRLTAVPPNTKCNVLCEMSYIVYLTLFVICL